MLSENRRELRVKRNAARENDATNILEILLLGNRQNHL